MITLYEYDWQTGEYLDKYETDSDPNEGFPPLQPGQFISNRPSATTIAPPAEQTGYARIYDRATQTWSLVEDHRGKLIYKKIDSTEKICDKIGKLVDFTLIAPTSEFDEWDGSKWIENVDRKNTTQINQIKSKAGEIILSYYSEYKQRNMIARGTEIVNAKTANTATQVDLDEETELQEAWDWIKAVRAKSNEMEDALIMGQDINIEVGSIDGNEYWPIHPSHIR